MKPREVVPLQQGTGGDGDPGMVDTGMTVTVAAGSERPVHLPGILSQRFPCCPSGGGLVWSQHLFIFISCHYLSSSVSSLHSSPPPSMRLPDGGYHHRYDPPLFPMRVAFHSDFVVGFGFRGWMAKFVERGEGVGVGGGGESLRSWRASTLA